MAQVILINDNQTLHDLLSVNLKTYVGVELIPRVNAEDTIALLDILPTIDLIIMQNEIGDEKTAEKITTYIKDKRLPTGMIVTGNMDEEFADSYNVIPDPSNWEVVVMESAKLLGIDETELGKKILPTYIPVPATYFLSMSRSCCDVFIRIKKGNNKFQYIKRIHADDEFSPEAIKKYMESGLKEFYISKDDQQQFTTDMSNQLVNAIEGMETKPIEKQIDILSSSHTIALDKLKSDGFTSETVQLTDSIIAGLIANCTAPNSKLAGILQKIIDDKNSYLYQHAHIITLVSSECLKATGMGGEQEHERLAYSAFFHDLAFVDKPHLAKIHSSTMLENAGLSEEEYKLVLNHAFEDSNFIRKHPEVPFGVDSIIRQHHGVLTGKGFSDGNPEDKLSPMAEVFMLSEAFAHEILLFAEHKVQVSPVIEKVMKEFEKNKRLFTMAKALNNWLAKK